MLKFDSFIDRHPTIDDWTDYPHAGHIPVVDDIDDTFAISTAYAIKQVLCGQAIYYGYDCGHADNEDIVRGDVVSKLEEKEERKRLIKKAHNAAIVEVRKKKQILKFIVKHFKVNELTARNIYHNITAGKAIG